MFLHFRRSPLITIICVTVMNARVYQDYNFLNSPWWESNPKPSDCRWDALTIWATRTQMESEGYNVYWFMVTCVQRSACNSTCLVFIKCIFYHPIQAYSLGLLSQIALASPGSQSLFLVCNQSLEIRKTKVLAANVGGKHKIINKKS